jgi:hypothetical protein
MTEKVKFGRREPGGWIGKAGFHFWASSNLRRLRSGVRQLRKTGRDGTVGFLVLDPLLVSLLSNPSPCSNGEEEKYGQ